MRGGCRSFDDGIFFLCYSKYLRRKESVNQAPRAPRARGRTLMSFFFLGLFTLTILQTQLQDSVPHVYNHLKTRIGE
jgi:hypothetical protein